MQQRTRNILNFQIGDRPRYSSGRAPPDLLDVAVIDFELRSILRSGEALSEVGGKSLTCRSTSLEVAAIFDQGRFARGGAPGGGRPLRREMCPKKFV